MYRFLFAILLTPVFAKTALLTTVCDNFSVMLSPPIAPEALLADSPFGINTAIRPDVPDLDARLAAMQQAGIKWGRQDVTWRRIEKVKANTTGASTVTC